MIGAMLLIYIKIQSITKCEIVQKMNSFFVKMRLVIILPFQVQETSKSQKNTEPLPLTTETSRPTTTFSVTSLTTIFKGAQTPTIATYTPESSESDRYKTATFHTSTFSVTSLIASVLRLPLLFQRPLNQKDIQPL